MLTGSLPPISRRSTYIETLELIDDDTGDAIDLTGAAITVEIRYGRSGDDYGWSGSYADHSATLESGAVTIPEDGIIQWRFEANSLRCVLPGSAWLSVLISRDGDTYEVARLSLPIED